MDELYKLDKSYSIIFHDENNIEFRNGVWNVCSHSFSDNSNQGILAKIILDIDEHGLSSVNGLAQRVKASDNDCVNIINELKKKELLIASGTQSRINERDNHHSNSEKLIKNKIHIIGTNPISELLQSIILQKLPHLNIVCSDKKPFQFIEESGEAIFRDSLCLEKILEKAEHIFRDSLVVTVNSFIDPIFNLYLNKIFHELKIPWFNAAIDGPFVYVGPIFDNHFCYECLDQRIFMNSKNSAEYLSHKKAIILKKIREGCPQVDASLTHLLCSLSAIEICNYLSSAMTISQQKILSLFMPTMEFSYHRILRLPGCRVCGVDNAYTGHQIHFDMGALLEQ